MEHLPVADGDSTILPGGLRLTAAHVLIGPGNHGSVYRLSGITSRNPLITRVFITPRDAGNGMGNGASDLSDTWAIRVVSVLPDGIVIHIRRLDDAAPWGMALRLDILALE